MADGEAWKLSALENAVADRRRHPRLPQEGVMSKKKGGKPVVHFRIQDRDLPLAACLSVGGFVARSRELVNCKRCLARRKR